MVYVSTHHQRERPYSGWPKDIRVARGLRAALDDALMDGAELVEVIALVRAAAGIEERV